MELATYSSIPYSQHVEIHYLRESTYYLPNDAFLLEVDSYGQTRRQLMVCLPTPQLQCPGVPVSLAFWVSYPARPADINQPSHLVL